MENIKVGLDYPYDDLDMKNAFEEGVKFAKSQSPWIKTKDQLPFVDEGDISEQSEPVLVIVSAKGHYEPEILVYNKYYHVWDTADPMITIVIYLIMTCGCLSRSITYKEEKYE